MTEGPACGDSGYDDVDEESHTGTDEEMEDPDVKEEMEEFIVSDNDELVIRPISPDELALDSDEEDNSASHYSGQPDSSPSSSAFASPSQKRDPSPATGLDSTQPAFSAGSASAEEDELEDDDAFEPLMVRERKETLELEDPGLASYRPLEDATPPPSMRIGAVIKGLALGAKVSSIGSRQIEVFCQR